MPARLSPSLKTLLKAPHARGTALPAPASLGKLFDSLARSAQEKGVGADAWVTLSTATLITLNSPTSLCELYNYITRDLSTPQIIDRAALMREAGLKCISFSGIPRAINSLGALRAHLPSDIASQLSTIPTRQPTPSNVTSIQKRAEGLWGSIYEPHATKLLQKLSDSHPDLPVHILSSHYGALLSDPPTPVEGVVAVRGGGGEGGRGMGGGGGRVKVGRVLTSIVAVSCLRAQGGVSPQVSSHVFGLRNAGEMGSGAENEEKVEGMDFLTSNEGAEWVLGCVDRIVEVVAGETVSFSGPSHARILAKL